MADSDKTVEYAVNATPTGFIEAMDKAKAAGKDSADKIGSAWSELGNKFKSVHGVVGALLGVLAGGAAFKAAVDATVSWGSEAGKLSKQLQVTTQTAAAYQVAMQHLGIDAGTLVDASDKMTKQLSKNESAFKTLGLETRNQNGSWRSTGDLLPEVMDKLRGVSNVTEQNIAGQQLFGKGWAEVRGLLKLSAEEMDHARQKVKDLNLEVDPKQVRAYKEALNDVKLIGTSLSVQMGNALLPALTNIGKFMGEEGPVMGKTFGLILEAVGFAASSLWLALKDMGDSLGAMAAQAMALLSGDLAGFKAIGAARDEEAKKNEATYERMKANFGQPLKPNTTIEKGDGGPHVDFSKDGAAKKESRVGQWDAQLEEARAAIERQGLLEGQFRQRSLSEDLAFYQTLLQRKDLTEQEKIQITRKAATIELAQIRETFDVQIKTLEAESAQYKNNVAEKIRIETEIQAKYAQGTKEYEAAQARINALQRQAGEQAKQVAQVRVDAERQARLATLALEEQGMQQAEQLQLVSREQALQAQAQFEERRNAIARQALQERLQAAKADPDRNPVELERINAELEALQQQHQLKMGQIKGNLQATQLEPLVNTYKSAEQALGNAINGILTRTQSLGQAMRTVWQGISSGIISEISKVLAKKAAAWAVERGLSLFGITTNAVEAGSGAAKSVAGIPMVGPALAIAAMASVMGAVMGMKSSVPSARMGYDIPAGLNPMTQLHEREMVLPAKHADVIRGMAEGQASALGGPTINYHDNTGTLTPAAIRDNAQTIARELARLDRQFFKPRS